MRAKTSLGQTGEDDAVRVLQERGYVPIQRNFRCPEGEIDLIARQGRVLCFVEVRSRRSAVHGHPVATVGRTKQRRLARAARAFLAQHPELSEDPIRFDVLGLVYTPRRRATLIQGAFEPPDEDPPAGI